MTVEELLLRRLSGQFLNKPASPLTVVSGLCGLQAQYLSHALGALSLRTSFPDTRGMVKSWTNRGTMHLFAQADLSLFLHRGRTHFLRAVDTMESDSYVSAGRKQFFSDVILDAVAGGTESRSDLKALCTYWGMTETESLSLFDPWGGIIRALCEGGKLFHQVSQEKAYRLCPDFEPMEKEPAQLELARRYFSHYGPATIRDAAWFFGCKQQTVKRWLARLPVHQKECQGMSFFWLEYGETIPQALPACLFLPGFDPLLLGYEKKNSLILPPEHLRSVYTLSGILRPALLMEGQIVGSWNLKNKKLTIDPFSPINRAVLIQEVEAAFPDLREFTII